MLALALVLAGCGGGANPAPKPISGPAKEVADVVQRLEQATAKHDFATICDELLASATRTQAGGANCPSVLRERGGSIEHPTIKIQAIEIARNAAKVRVRTTATGQAAAINVIRLVFERGRYRISSLGR